MLRFLLKHERKKISIPLGFTIWLAWRLVELGWDMASPNTGCLAN